jgi:hypothetical protein
LQLNGIANAFRQREVVAAIQSGRAGAIDVVLLLWGGEITETISSGWYRVSTEREAEAFAARVSVLRRRAYGTTAVGNGIMAALTLLSEVPQRAGRRCIDVSGDGRETMLRGRRPGISPTEARFSAESSQVTINALAIQNEETDLREWYRLNIVTEDGSSWPSIGSRRLALQSRASLSGRFGLPLLRAQRRQNPLSIDSQFSWGGGYGASRLLKK